MVIGFTGAHGTGKSTLLQAMINWPELQGHAFVPGLTRMQSKNGVKINKEGNFEGQKALTKTMCWHLKNLPRLVVDRTLLDIYAYTVYQRDHKLITSHQLNYIRTQARAHQNKFDVVFYIRPEFEIKGDGVRNADPAFQLEIAAAIEHAICNEPLGTKRIILLSGTVEERLADIKSTFDYTTQ